MRDLNIPAKGAKRRILDAAQKLFADKGFDAVSIRDITQLAKANVAAINYHFGSRDGLIGVVMTLYISPIESERLRLLDIAEKEAAGKPVALPAIIDALVRPLAEQVRQSELSEQMFYKLMGRIFSDQHQLSSHVMQEKQATLHRFKEAFAKALPELDREELIWRMHFMTGGMLYMLSHHETLRRLFDGEAGEPSMEQCIKRFIHYATAGFRGICEKAEQGKRAAKSPGTPDVLLFE